MKIAIDLPAAVHRDLALYAELLAKETSQAAVEPAKLIPPMIARFMASDRAFAKAKRDRPETIQMNDPFTIISRAAHGGLAGPIPSLRERSGEADEPASAWLLLRSSQTPLNGSNPNFRRSAEKPHAEKMCRLLLRSSD